MVKSVNHEIPSFDLEIRHFGYNLYRISYRHINYDVELISLLNSE